MTKFRVYALMCATKEIGTFEAESEEEAIEMGLNDPECCSETLCHYCSDRIELGDIDEVKAEQIEE